MKREKKGLGIILFLLFVLSFYLVEFGIAGDSVVAMYNNGFGTFDMKPYNVTVIQDVLSQMNSDGIKVYQTYYIFDFFFILMFGLFQCYLSVRLFKWWKIKYAAAVVCVIPIARGLFDAIENVMLLSVLFSYPKCNVGVIGFSYAMTRVKFICIRLWMLEALVGIIVSVVIFVKNKVVHKCKG